MRGIVSNIWRTNRRMPFYLLTVAGIIVRLLWVVCIPNEPVSDFAGYHLLASNIYHHQGYSISGNPVAFQGVGYPFLLGWFFRLMGSTSVFYGKMFNLLFSSITLPLFCGLSLNLFKEKRLAVAFYALVVFLPNYIAYTSVLGTETIALFLFALVLFMQMQMEESFFKYVLLGLGCGILGLIKPFFLAYPLLAAAALWIKEKKLKKTLARLTISFIAMCLVIAPWTLRNYRVYKLFIPVSYNAGYMLMVNNNSANSNGMWMPLAEVPLPEELENRLEDLDISYDDFQKHPDEYAMEDPRIDSALQAEAEKWIASHPIAFIKLGLMRIQATFFSAENAGDIYSWAINSGRVGGDWLVQATQSPGIQLFLKIYLMVLSLAGLFFVLLQVGPAARMLFFKDVSIPYRVSVPLLNLFFFTAVPFLFEGQPRYAFLMLFVFVFCFLEIFPSAINGCARVWSIWQQAAGRWIESTIRAMTPPGNATKRKAPNSIGN